MIGVELVSGGVAAEYGPLLLFCTVVGIGLWRWRGPWAVAGGAVAVVGIQLSRLTSRRHS